MDEFPVVLSEFFGELLAVGGREFFSSLMPPVILKTWISVRGRF